MPQNEIHQATGGDLQAILNLQYLAYQSEARLLDNGAIPPLRETLPEVEEQFRTGLFLKAIDGATLIGSVRGHALGGTFFIGKLMVHPDHQGKGLGKRLLAEIERRAMALPIKRYELFTSDKSAHNLRLYEKMGYVRFKEQTVAPGLHLVYLEKQCPVSPLALPRPE